MATTVVNSFNIFVDTGRCTSSQSRGDDIHLPLSETPISCADNQFLKLTLQDFNMFKNFPNVNNNNSIFRVVAPGQPAQGANPHNFQLVSLPQQNYKNVTDVASAFAASVITAVVALYPGVTEGTPGVVSPAALATDEGNTDNIIKFQIDFTANNTFGNFTEENKPIIQFRVVDGDTYELLGGDKITDTTDITTSSITCELVAGAGNEKKLDFTCRYPAQRATEQHVYLRSDLPSTNLHTESYDARNSDDKSTHVSPSRILGKIPISNDGCFFHTETGNEYTLNLKQKNFTMMRLFLTDSHGRQLPVQSYEKAGTVGNFSFKCTVKVEIVQHLGQQNNQLQTERPQKSVSARFGTAPLEYLDYGGVRKNR